MDRYEFSESNRKMLEAFNIPMVIYQLIDMRVVTLLVTDGMCKIMGESREDIVRLFDNDMYRDTHPDDKARVADAALKFAQGGDDYDVVYRSFSKIINDYAVVHAHGEHYMVEDGTLLSTTVYVVEGLSKNEDNPLTEKIQSNFNSLMSKESLIRDNFYDTLTGLPNMSYFLQLADAGKKQIMMGGLTPVMLFFDLVGMKSYNNKYGLQGGDTLLIALADILRKHFSNENCGRLGQDHYAVFTSDVCLEDILETVFIELQNACGGRSLPVHVGIYKLSFEDVSSSTACDRAKIAADKVKGIYKSQFIYYSDDIHENSNRYYYVLNTFEQALENKWIVPFYQPIVRSVNGNKCDVEALARWIDPVKGIIPPDEFIYVLEDAKLIYKLDLHILDCVIADLLKAKEQQGLPVVPVSINFSKYDFILCDIVTEVENRVVASGLDKEIINFEITESVSSFDDDFVKGQIAKVHHAGFKIWMDDFGSGYSSLNMLQKFDFDAIKIDMHFMRSFDENKRSRIILKELIQMAVFLNMDTVVEGVETIEQSKFLRDVGASKMQGFFLGKPISYADSIAKIKAVDELPTEKYVETDYYNTITRANLIEPESIFEDYRLDSDEFFGPLPIGVLEFIGDEIRVLRYNKTYALYLKKGRFINEEDLGTQEIKLIHQPQPEFLDAVDRCIKSGKWECPEFIQEKDILSNCFVKLMAKNDLTGAYAIQIIIVTIR